MKRKTVLVSVCLLCLLAAFGAARAAGAEEGGQGAVTVQAVAAANGRLRVETTIDKKFVSKVYELKNAKAAELQPLIAEALAPEQGTVSPVSFDGSELLVISAPSYMIPGLDATVAALDKKDASVGSDGKDNVYYKPKHRLPSELAALAAEAGASSLGGFVADDVNNVIYFSDTPNALGAVKNALKEFDVPQAQAEIEVRIVEIDERDSERIGLLWDTWKKALPESADASCARERSRSAADGFARSTSWGVDFSSFSPQALADFVNYMVRHGAAEVRTTTRLCCVQRTTATITAGDVHRFLTAAQPAAEGPAKKLVDTVVDGLAVSLTPYIGAESIRLEIAAEVSSMSGFDPNGLPVVNSRTVTAAAVLKDGEVFTISGLERETKVSGKEHVFLLGHIPVLGDWLFTTHSSVKRKSQLVVVLTPRLLGNASGGVRPPDAPKR